MDWGSLLLGAFGSAPLTAAATWQVDRRRDRYGARRKLVADARQLVAGAAEYNLPADRVRNDVRYMALRRHLRQKIAVSDLNLDVTLDGGTRPTYLRNLAAEIDRLERRWRLT